MARVDNYQIQAAQAKKLFLQYDQTELIQRCKLQFDKDYFYFSFLSQRHRLCRHSGDLQRCRAGLWVDANSFGEVMTILDWLCDSKPHRYPTGRWINVVSQGHYFHNNLQEDEYDPNAALFSSHPADFCRACQALGGRKTADADISYAIELVDGLEILVQLWHGDDEFPARLRFLWDENALLYLRYETTWYAIGLLLRRIKENMECTGGQI